MKYAIIVIATVATLVVMLTAPSLEAARSSGKIGGLSIGLRSKSVSMADGLTVSTFGEKRLYKSIAVFVVFDYHWVGSQRPRLNTEWLDILSRVGVGGDLGVKLNIPERASPVCISPGVAVGLLALPRVAFGPGQFGTARLSLELAIMSDKRAGFMVEASSLAVISGGEEDRGIGAKPIVSVRAGVIWRVK